MLVPTRYLFDKRGVTNSLKFLQPALDLILPERCPSCGVITPIGGGFCAGCWPQLHFLTQPWCTSCASPMPFESNEGQQCAACLEKPPLHDGIRAAVAYGDISRQVALRFKHGGKIGMAKLIAKHLLRHIPDEPNTLLFVPVPLHWTRLWSRGFNQSALIAQILAKESLNTFAPDLLLRRKRTPLLRGMSSKQRYKTVSSAFALNPSWNKQVAGSRIILVDDVLTTGATTNACVKTLKQSGAKWVQVFCWARVLRGEADLNLNGT
jgi:ComF family protein